MNKMQSSYNVFSRYKFLRYGMRTTILLSPALYLILWDIMIRSDVLTMIQLPFRFFTIALTGEMARVQVSAVPEVVLWRAGWLPVYWSKLGDLTPYHGIFSIGYIIYLGNTFYNLGMKKLGNKTLNRISFLDLEIVKKFWIVFGVIAFLTTSLSTSAILTDLIAFIYYVIYLIGLPLAPFSLYLWWKKRINANKWKMTSLQELIIRAFAS